MRGGLLAQAAVISGWGCAMVSTPDRRRYVELINEARTAGARLRDASAALGICPQAHQRCTGEGGAKVDQQRPLIKRKTDCYPGVEALRYGLQTLSVAIEMFLFDCPSESSEQRWEYPPLVALIRYRSRYRISAWRQTNQLKKPVKY